MDIFRSAPAILGESLTWDAATGSMLWTDITAGQLHSSHVGDPVDGGDDLTVQLPPPLASFGLADIRGQRGFIVSLGDRVVLSDRAGSILHTVAWIEHSHPGMRLNEGKVDPHGSWVTGSMDLTTGDPDGAFYAISPGGDLRTLRGGIGVGNGLEWSLDGTRIYFTDTSVSTVYTGRYSETGDITEVEPFLTDGPHDGLTIDVDGCLWSAFYGEGRVARFSPTGERMLELELPAPNVTSVAFGGADLRTLFVASARENLTEEQLLAHPLSGSIFTIPTETRGRESRTFSA